MPIKKQRWHPDEVRARVNAGQLLKRLGDHAAGELTMSPTQIKAAEILLKKVLPDLRQTEVTGPEGGPVLSNINLRFVDAPADPTPSSSEDTDD